MKKNKITPLKTILRNTFLSEEDNRNFSIVTKLKKNWSDICGDRVSKITFPYNIKNNTLYVAVTDNAWLLELNHIKDKILIKLEELELNDIVFKMDKSFKKGRGYNKINVNILELTYERESFIKNVTNNINDEELKKSFKKLMLTYFTTDITNRNKM